MTYTKTTWVASTSPAISAPNLNNLETQHDAILAAAYPTLVGSSNKYLGTDGSTVSWSAPALFYIASASDTLQKADDTTVSSNSTTYIKVKSIYIPTNYLAGGVYRIKFTMDMSAYGGGPYYGKIYLDATAVGTERSLNGGENQTWSEDLTLTRGAGSAIQLYIKTNNVSYPAYAKNFRVYCTNTTASFAW